MTFLPSAPSSPAVGPSPLRVALYGHDSYGLGHLRRNLRLAAALAGSERPVEVLVLTGSPRAYAFATPSEVQIAKLPSVTKGEDGRYVSLQAHVPLERTVNDRRGRLRELVLAFAPHVLVVDHAPLGLEGELLPLLADLRRRTSTLLIAGLRDILDEADVVRSAWRRTGTCSVLDALYHHVFVYGDRSLFSLERLYALPPRLARRLRYLGYLAPPLPRTQEPAPSVSLDFPDPSRPHLLCMTGGGGDGEALATAFLAALELPPGRLNGTLVTGPFLPKPVVQKLHARFGANPHVQILRFTGEIERLIAGSDAVVSMGGYNSVVEALSLRRRLLVVPRVKPRREQLLRAEAFARRDLLSVLLPDAVGPERLLRSIQTLLEAPPPSPVAARLAWNGVGRFRRAVHALGRSPALPLENLHAYRRLA